VTSFRAEVKIYNVKGRGGVPQRVEEYPIVSDP